MSDSKWSEHLEEELFESKTKSFQPRRKISEVEITFRKSVWKLLEISDKPIPKTISCRLVIRLGQFTEEELDSVVNKIKSRKVAWSCLKYRRQGNCLKYRRQGSCLKYRRQGNLIPYFFDYGTYHINKTQQRNEEKATSSLFPWKVTSKL